MRYVVYRRSANSLQTSPIFHLWALTALTRSSTPSFRCLSTKSRDESSSPIDTPEGRIASLDARGGIKKYYPRWQTGNGSVNWRGLPAYDASTVLKEFGARDLSQRETDKNRIALYGRVRRLRRHGRKLYFIETESGGGLDTPTSIVQAVFDFGKLQDSSTPVSLDELSEAQRSLRRGDWIIVSGYASQNRVGETILTAQELPTILSPALRDVPERLDDPEFKMRNRHADAIVNTQALEVLYLRSKLLGAITSFFNSLDFVQVQTPIIVAGAGGAAARPFQTTATEFSDAKLNLRIAPELFLKRLITAGMPRVYELGQAFRNEGIDSTHNPEFAICEFYGILLGLKSLMGITEELFRKLSDATTEMAQNFSSIPPPKIDFKRKFREKEFIPALEQAISERISNWTFPDLKSEHAETALTETFRALDIPLPSPSSIPHLLDSLASQILEPTCIEPTFITWQPACMSPLAKSIKYDYGDGIEHEISARAELFIGGMEYVNCYEEENSPIEQRRKFEDQARLNDSIRESGDAGAESYPIDESYLKMLEWGMPPTGGWGAGIDRIVMLFAGKSRIADVLPFGNLRNVVSLGAAAGKD